MAEREIDIVKSKVLAAGSTMGVTLSDLEADEVSQLCIETTRILHSQVWPEMFAGTSTIDPLIGGDLPMGHQTKLLADAGIVTGQKLLDSGKVPKILFNQSRVPPGLGSSGRTLVSFSLITDVQQSEKGLDFKFRHFLSAESSDGSLQLYSSGNVDYGDYHQARGISNTLPIFLET